RTWCIRRSGECAESSARPAFRGCSIIGGIFGVRVIFPCRRCVRQSSPCWTVKPYCEVFRKQQVMFPSGKPLSGHQPTNRSLNTIKNHLEIYLITPCVKSPE